MHTKVLSIRLCSDDDGIIMMESSALMQTNQNVTGVKWMAGIADFHCTYDHASGFGDWIREYEEIRFPEAYLEAEAMVNFAKVVKLHNRTAMCQLPFCHTLEAEALGGNIRLGDGITGPRTGAYRCGSLEEVIELPPLDPETEGAKRIQETLKACKRLKEDGESVIFLISGPITILNGLVDADVLFRALLKKPELMERIFEKLGNDILTMMKAAEAAGADLLSYGDPAGGVNLVGPKVAARVAKTFTAPFFSRADQELKKETTVLFCPKTAFALIGTEMAEWKDHVLPAPMEYLPAVLYKKKQIRFAGQDCINRTGHRLENGILKELILK